MNQPISISVSAHSQVCLIPGRPEEYPQKYLGKSMFRTVCVTRRVVSLRAETSETCERWFLRSYIKTHAWKGWKGTKFPSQQHRGELHQGLSSSSALANRVMDGFTQSWEMGREGLKFLSPSWNIWALCTALQTRVMGSFLYDLYNLLCHKPSPKSDMEEIGGLGMGGWCQQELLAVNAKGRSLPRQCTAGPCAELKCRVLLVLLLSWMILSYKGLANNQNIGMHWKNWEKLIVLHPQVAATCLCCLKSCQSHLEREKSLCRVNQIQHGVRYLYSVSESKTTYNIFSGRDASLTEMIKEIIL